MKCNTILIELIFTTKLTIEKVLHMKQYTQLKPNERALIFEFTKAGWGNNMIASALGRNKSTISRERKRNSDEIGYLYPTEAQSATNARKARYGPKVSRNPKLEEYVIDKLHEFWAPDAIAGRWSKERPDQSITTEAVYTFIYSERARKLELWKLLPRKKRKRGMVRKPYKTISILNRVSIDQRPKYIERRKEPGHFEGDLFFNTGSMSANVLNLVDRKSRMTMLFKNDSKLSEPIIDRIGHAIGAIAKSVTFDNGKEFAMHKRLQETHGIRTYFCDPGSPWQKGSVENLNGALRRYLPFKVPAHTITQDLLNEVANIINNIPRRSLKFLTPVEVFEQNYRTKYLSVALHY
jgi:IS30 family transposase